MCTPDSKPHSLAATDESFPVYEGQVELRVPLTVNLDSNHGLSEVTVSGEIHWQSCDDQVCDIPSQQRFAFTLPVNAAPKSMGTAEASALEPNVAQHFQRMIQRRQDQGSHS